MNTTSPTHTRWGLRQFVLLALLLGWLVAAPASAKAGAPGALPQRGRTMHQVLTHFGQPQARHGPVGRPAITRWDYAGFVVVFEHNLVLDSFRPGQAPDIYHRNQLARAQSVNR